MTSWHTRAAIDDIATVRVRSSREAFRRIGSVVKAARYERGLAEIDTWAPEAWAVDEPAGRRTS